MLSLFTLLLLLLRSVVSENHINGQIFQQALEDFTSESLGLQEIQVVNVFFIHNKFLRGS